MDMAPCIRKSMHNVLVMASAKHAFMSSILYMACVQPSGLPCGFETKANCLNLFMLSMEAFKLSSFMQSSQLAFLAMHS